MSQIKREVIEKEEFLLEEYRVASQLTFHVDALRNKIIGFLLTLGGIIIAVFTAYRTDGSFPAVVAQNYGILLIAFCSVGIIGICSIIIIGRLRCVQIEHCRIMNNIRKYFLDMDYEAWNAVELSERTLPNPNRKSGTYFAAFTLFVLTSVTLTLAIYVFLVESNYVLNTVEFIVLTAMFVFFADSLYFYVALPRPEMTYSYDYPPFEN
jgi:hypothetical protein